MNFRLFLENHDEDGFLQNIINNRYDHTPRLIYADWLEEHGDDFWSVMIRTAGDEQQGKEFQKLASLISFS